MANHSALSPGSLGVPIIKHEECEVARTAVNADLVSGLGAQGEAAATRVAGRGGALPHHLSADGCEYGFWQS